MRKVALFLAIAIFTLCSLTVFAQVTQSQKDECLLASKNCVNQVDDIHKRMKRIDKEIKKGTKVYSPQELKNLQQKLSETQELLRSMETAGN